MIRYRHSLHVLSAYLILTLAAAPLAAMAGQPLTGLVKLTPSTVTVDMDISPRQTTIEGSPWSLFDRDTDTWYAPEKMSRVIVTLPTEQELGRVSLYGSASYRVNLYREAGGAWEPVPSLSALDPANFKSTWNAVEIAPVVTAAKIMLEFIPSGKPGLGVREMELWGTSPVPVTETAHYTLAGITNHQDVQTILGANPPHIQKKDAAPSEIAFPSTATADSQRAVFMLPQITGLYKRAYLFYEGFGQPRPVSIKRRINGLSWSGGFAVPQPAGTVPSWIPQLEEINPRWLVSGENHVDLTPADSSMTVRNMGLLLETDSGWNSVASVHPALLYDGDTATFAQLSPSSEIRIHFDRVVEPAAILLHVPYAAAVTGRLQHEMGGEWLDVQPSGKVDFSALAPGWNEVRLPAQVSTKSLRLLIESAADGQSAVIDEVLAAASPVGPNATEERIVVAFPRDGEYFARTAFIQGFIIPGSNDPKSLSVTVEGKADSRGANDGSFSLALSKDETGFASQADDDAWAPRIQAAFSPNTSIIQALPLFKNSSPSDTGAPVDDEAVGKKVSEKLAAGQAKKIALGKAILDIPADALSTAAEISITALSAEEIAALDTGMTNVTAPDHGYRFLPHGSRFKKKITVTLPYDPAAIPSGLAEQDVTTYYFDENAGAWKPLEKVRVDTGQKVVVSLTDHFTDMINATLTAPDHPQAVSFNPTSIKDIKAADPGAGVNLIEAPKANNMGDARLSYPIDVPPGRNGMQPQIAVQYSSSGGNGWMGVGWDIPTQSITIDTRWGVPRYDTGLETETYLLDGEQLTPVAHRGELQPRTAEKVFHSRVEGQFRRIVRHGDRPDNYWWEVTDKSGTRYSYGGDLDGGRMDTDAVLADPAQGAIFKWALREARDSNGNTIRYHYDIVRGGESGEPWREIYLKTIRYTGRPGVDGPYQVSFQREHGRADVAVDGRPGFKTVLADRLKSIEVSLAGSRNTSIRGYGFEYKTGQYQKTLLARVTQFGEDGRAFNSHEFDYYDEVATTDTNVLNGFRIGSDVSGAKTVSGEFLLGDQNSTALGGTSTTDDQVHFYGGIAFGTLKMVSVGLKVGADFADSKTLLTLTDINGDGIPDQIFRNSSNGRVSFRPGLQIGFGAEQELPTLGQLGKEDSQTLTFGAQLFAYGATVLGDLSFTRTRGTAYLSDVNGDGLPDLVDNGAVYFNHVTSGIPTFDATSPTPLGTGAASNTAGLVENPEEARAEMERHYHLVDPVRRWIAPYSGTISIVGGVRLTTAPPAGHKTADGVRVSIQHNGGEIWNTTISDPLDSTVKAISGLEGFPVHAGDRIYFRVNSIDDGAYDTVEFNPAITYVGADTTRTDENGMPQFAFKPESDFSFGGRPLTWGASVAGSATLSGTFVKNAVTTDDVRVEVLQNGSTVYSQTVARDRTGGIPISVSLTTLESDSILIRITSDTRIDLSGIRFAPRMVFTQVNNVSQVADPQGNPLFAFYPPVTAQVYPRNASQTPYVPWVAPQTGTIRVNQKVSSNSGAAMTLAVKKPGSLLAKQRVESGSAELNAEIRVGQGDSLYFTADTSATDAGAGEARIEYLAGGPTVTWPVDIHVGMPDSEPFGGGFRNWWYGQYNGNDKTGPINESLLRLPNSQDDQVIESFMGMLPFTEVEHWSAHDKDCWVGGAYMSATRLMVKHLDFSDGSELGGARGIVRQGGARAKVISAATGGFGVGLTHGKNWSDVDFLDFNGDRYPDIVGGGMVQATLPNGALGDRRYGVGGFGRVRFTESDNTAINLGATGTSTISDSRARTLMQKSEMASYNLSVGISGSKGDTDTKWDLVDINGDGLPDYVWPGANGLAVRLNLGYRFGADELWGGTDRVRSEHTNSIGANIGGGFGGGGTDWAYGFGGGAAQTLSKAVAEQDLVDVNGDGLVDIVRKRITDDTLLDSDDGWLSVRFNTGNGFTGPYTFTGALPHPLRANATYSRNIGAHFTISIWIPYTTLSVVLNPGYYHGESLGGYEVMLSDIDGDGYADHVYSDTNGRVRIMLNNTGRTNLLKSVKRPLGATMGLEYERSGNTYDQPQSRWVLSKTIVHDGFAGDGVDRLVTTCRYEGGKYDRTEREFYGYRTVTEEQRDAGNSEALYRKSVHTFRTDSYYTKGLPERELMTDATNRPYSGSGTTYRLVDAFTGSDSIDPQSTTATVFPQLFRTEHYYYEGNPNPGKFTYNEFGYDRYGNVSRFFDAGDVGAGDDVAAAITYTNYQGPYIVGKPASMTVTSNGKELRRREGTYDGSTGNLLEVRQYLENGRAAITDLGYFENGNLRSVTGPTNLKGQRYSLAYEYDPEVRTYFTAIADSFGYRSTAAYSYKYGKVETTTDTNGNRIETRYDNFGRTIKVFGPEAVGTGIPDITFEYHPDDVVPWALTRHYDPYRSLTDTIDTVLFTDGLKRVIQTKKDASIFTGADSAAADVMTVSGRAIFDGLGRTVRQYYPVTEGLGRAGAFNPAFDNIPPTRFQYDVLDRTLKTTLPDGASTTTAFGFGPDRNGTTRFETTVTDANGNVKKSYTDVQEQITSVKEFNRGGAETIWTSYDYDPLQQITMVTDDHNNRTTVSYDNLGRRTVIDNPDTGKTLTVYDLAGNATAKITANLAMTGKQISYDYDFNRLKTISYPDFPGNNVAYAYGEPGAKHNRAGRIVTVTDASGKEERFYGKLGETVKEIKTVNSKTQGNSANSPELYETSYTFDTFGRLQRLVYPDGEALTNLYDAGGLLRAATGTRGSFRFDYLKRLEYDKFEQRAFVQYGNNTRSSYTYDPYNRRLAGLKAGKGDGNPFQNLSYGYDKVGNILSLKNDVALPSPNEYGGPTEQRYRYDDLYRLTEASGLYQFGTGKLDTYELSMGYDTIHNILNKNQVHKVVQPSGTLVTQKKTTYNWNYAYSSPKPHASVHIGEMSYSYDDNGNQTGWTSDANGTRRTIVWDEENRVQSIFDNGHQKEYVYNDSGERVIKRGPQGETVYANQFFVVRNRSTATKHIFAGTTRIASRMQPGTNNTNGNGNGNGIGNDDNFLYFYHPDHLGSTSHVTDVNGKLYEHLEYFPFGETWVEEHSNTQRTPYLYTGKELDEETGLYYYGARYYDPRTSVWQSADPILRKYLPSQRKSKLPAGGVYQPVNLNVYHYATNNPLKFIDPDGLWGKDVHLVKTEEWSLESGFSTMQAKKIAQADNYVDAVSSGKSFLPLIGDQGYHFNIDETIGNDSRMQRFQRHFDEAVKLGKISKSLRSAESSSIYGDIVNNIIADLYEAASLKELGTGLHPLQDTDAHNGKYQKKFLGIYYHDQDIPLVSKNLADDPVVEPERLVQTKRNSTEALKEYQRLVNSE